MADEVILLEIRDEVATLILNRPKVRNALNAALREALFSAVTDLEAERSVNAIVLTGADPAFCAGLDLKELAGEEHRVSELVGAADRRQNPLPQIGKPVIGAINGVAVTGGLEVALNCDFLVASEYARFADTHARVGVHPGWGLTALLPQAIGVRRAKEMSATGNYIDASTALDWGLVNHVVPHADLLPFCYRLAADIISNDQQAVTAIFDTYQAGSETTVGETWAIEARRAREWVNDGGGQGPEIARRRVDVQSRGRIQSNP